jgi:hypothetical protein
VLIKDAEGVYWTWLKGKGRIRERGGMLAGMVLGMVKFWLSTGFNHQGNYMA